MEYENQENGRELPSEPAEQESVSETSDMGGEIAPEQAALTQDDAPDGQADSTENDAIEADAPDEQAAPAETPKDEPAPPSEPTVVYRWDYTEQHAADTQRAGDVRRSGAWTFGIVMTVCFAVALAVLIASLGIGGFDRISSSTGGSGGSSWRDSFDYGNELDSEASDALTLQEISARGNHVVVAISVKKARGSGAGSGIILTEDGYIATNAHVVEGATSVTVQTYEGDTYAAEVIGSSEIDDLAVLKIDATGLTAATFGNSADVMVGDRAVVIGHPAGLMFGWTSTFGYVSAINRDVSIRNYDGTLAKKMTLIQTDATVNSGNSGGPMFNSRGEVIGIITMKLRGDYEGMGFAIPSNGALPLLASMMETGTTDGVQSEVATQRPQVGVTGVSVKENNWYLSVNGFSRMLTEEEAAEVEGSFYATATGVWVTSVTTATDAYNKIVEGDIITAIDGTKMSSIAEMREYLYTLRVGDTVEITYVREGVEATVSVLLTPPIE